MNDDFTYVEGYEIYEDCESVLISNKKIDVFHKLYDGRSHFSIVVIGGKHH